MFLFPLKACFQRSYFKQRKLIYYWDRHDVKQLMQIGAADAVASWSSTWPSSHRANTLEATHPPSVARTNPFVHTRQAYFVQAMQFVCKPEQNRSKKKKRRKMGKSKMRRETTNNQVWFSRRNYELKNAKQQANMVCRQFETMRKQHFQNIDLRCRKEPQRQECKTARTEHSH